MLVPPLQHGMRLLRSAYPEPVHVALVNAGSGATLAKVAAYPLIAFQAALIGLLMKSPAIEAAAAFAAVTSLPRAGAMALWHHRRNTIVDGATARRWELLMLATGLPFSLAVGLIAFTSVLHGETAWMTVECTIALGYAASFTTSIGFRPNVATAFIAAAIIPIVLACLLIGDAPSLTLALMAIVFILVQRANIVAISDAVVARTILQQDAYQSARMDPLTSLQNRRAFDERIADITTKRETIALILCDLDGFKEVNDSFGHKAGDALLLEISTRLQSLLIDDESAYRLGGDEFGILCTPARAESLAEKCIAACQIPIFYNGDALHVSASAGIALGIDQTVQQLADGALYTAKGEGRACWRRAPSAKLVARNEQLRSA